MNKPKPASTTSAVPSGRLSRFARMTKIAAGVASGMVVEGVRQIKDGNRPNVSDLLLTPGNAKRITDELANLRGAAMKLGQMLSMDSGDMMPGDLAEVFSRLRSNAQTMPWGQLNTVLTKAYGKKWADRFRDFEYTPMAAASIGQVHRALTLDGQDIALKVQYPGIRKSINADVENVATLLRMSGQIPGGFNIKPLLAGAKRQLHDEANYLTEAKFLKQFGDALARDERFVVPLLYEDLTTDSVLAMSHVSGDPIEDVALLPQEERDRVVLALVELMLHELLNLRMMQTDPNFANYRYQPDTGRIVLLDFGATRHFDTEFAQAYRDLFQAMLDGDDDAIVKSARRGGYTISERNPGYRQLLLDMFKLVGELFSSAAPYAFRDSTLPAQLADKSLQMKNYRDDWKAPPIDAIFFHRKLAGLFLLASRIDARVPMREVMEKFL
jgi:predicted unusual protein kinase regulating ubiquinone biosynthesis (AarF/ABC1/UbiB family)